MSYILFIWEASEACLPDSVQAAEAIQSRLSEQSAAQNPRFVELAAQLAQRFPTQPEEEYWVWTDEPPTGQSVTPVYVLGVADPANLEALRTVREQCMKLGLVLFDMQVAEVCLPDGRILCLPGNTPAVYVEGGASDRRLTAKEALEVVRRGLEPLMAQYGFIWTKGRGKRPAHVRVGSAEEMSLYWPYRDAGFFNPQTGISFNLRRDADVWRLRFYLVHPDILNFRRYAFDYTNGFIEANENYYLGSVIWDVPRLMLQAGFEPQSPFTLQPVVRGKDGFDTGPQAELESWLANAESVFAKILPVLAECGNWATIDRFTSKGDLSLQAFGKYAADISPIGRCVEMRDVLMIAWLAGNTALDALADHLLLNYCHRSLPDPPISNAIGLLLRLMNTPDTRARPAHHWVLTAPSVEQLAPDAPLEQEAQILFAMCEALQHLLSPHGFTWDDTRRAFVRPMAAFNQIISPVCECGVRPFRFRLDVHLWDSPQFRDLLAAFKEVPQTHPLLESGLRASLPQFAQYAQGPLPPLPEDPAMRHTLVSAADVQACAEFNVAYLREAVLPVLDACTDWAGVDRYCNTSPIVDQPFGRLSMLDFQVPPEFRISGIDCIAKILVAVLAERTNPLSLLQEMPPEERFIRYNWTNRSVPSRLRALIDKDPPPKPFELALEPMK